MYWRVCWVIHIVGFITAAATAGFDTYRVVFKLFPPKDNKENKWKYPKCFHNCSIKKIQKITKYHDNSYNCSSQKVLGGKLKQVYTKKLNQLNSFCWSSMCACSICTVHLSTVKKEKEWQFDTNEKKTTSDARFKKAEEIKHDAIINLKFNVNINLNF